MMLDTWDGQIWYPRFYDIDTILSYDNSGEIKFDVDIEMEQGYWNTSSSRLWTKVRDYMHDELVETYKDMRANGVTYEGIMRYMYDEQIAKIPQTYYNKDFDIKYAPYSDTYIGKAHGDGYQHMKRWLKNRFTFCDTLYDYAPSYNNDVLTIRANTLNEMNLTIETYTPLYQHVSFYNGNMEKIKITPGQPATFKGFAQTETDQEVLIYGGSNIKKITGIQSMNPNSMLIGGATRLSELDISNCPILTIVNSNKANFSPHTYLNKLNISNCPQLGGNLNVSNSPLLQEIDARNSAITGLLLPTSLRNLEVMRLPNTIQDLTLHDVPLLHTVELDEGNTLQNISLSNCSNLTNCINFDLTKVPSISLDNSFDTEEIYMSETTNLTLKNMPSLKRVIFTPNSEYSAFDINNVLNGKNYKITTFNNPMMTDFITTAPFRLSYNKDEYCRKEYVDIEERIYPLNGVSYKNGFYLHSGTGEIAGSGTCYVLESYLDVTYPVKYEVSSSSSNSNIVRVCYYDIDKNYITFEDKNMPFTFIPTEDVKYIRIHLEKPSLEIWNSITISNEEIKGYVILQQDDITPNTVFTANTLDLADTQFQNVKFLCTTDIYNLKVPTSMKNFYADSAFDIDTEVIVDASYEVIHEELIEPYTTNYEGEVNRFRSVLQTITIDNFENPNMSFSTDTGELNKYANYNSTGYMFVQGGTEIAGVQGLWIAEYDKNLNYIGYLYFNTTNKGTLNNQTRYILISISKEITSFDITGHFDVLYTPNIIPSSANGSLIFNMYSNNTTQPTSTSPYMWDLTGLKLEDFYTYGTNNWVKASEDSYVEVPNYEGLVCTPGKYGDKLNVTYYDGGQASRRVVGIFKLEPGTHTLKQSVTDNPTVYYSTSPTGTVSAKYSAKTWTTTETIYFVFYDNANNIEWVEVDGLRYYVDKMINTNATGSVDILEYSNNKTCTPEIDHLELSEVKSITMPQRMPGYSVRLVNADITPDEYPTMLYPKLIDTGLPITGKLDYTKYNGTSLAWAYAYTTDDVNINPLDSRSQGNITQDYNKLYGTDYVDIIDVWIYKDTDVSKLSTNEAITKAYIELTNDNYKTRIDEVLAYYPNCTDLYLFEDGSMTSLSDLFNSNGNTNTKTQIKKVTFMDGYFTNINNISNTFNGCGNFEVIDLTALKDCKLQSLLWTFIRCSNLTQIIGIDLLDVSSVSDFGCTFYGCEKLTSIDTSKWVVKNGASFSETFKGCTSLTTAPVIPQGVTNINKTFENCKALTTAPAIPSGVTNLSGCFANCGAITDWSNMLDFQFDKVTVLESTFRGTQVSTSIFKNKTMITSRVGIRYLFQYYKGTEFIAPENFTFGSTQNNEVEFHSVWGEGNASTIDLSNLKFVENTVVNFYNAFFGGYSGNDKLQRIIFPECNLKGANMAFQGNRALTYIDMSKADASTCTDWGNPFNQYNTALTTFKPPKNISTNLDLSPCTALEEEWVHAVVDNLAEVESATLTLNETLGAYLTPDEVFSANAKGWTIVGASNDFTIVNAGDDMSGYTTDENVLSCFIELTSANYKTRIDEVLQYYPNCTDLYLFDDGSVTSLRCFISNGYFTGEVNNTTYATSQVKKITFIVGYFENVTDLTCAFTHMRGLDEINNLPNNATNMQGIFYRSTVKSISNIPSKVTGMTEAFRETNINCKIDLSNLSFKSSNALERTFQGCTLLTITPILPSNYTGNMTNTFLGCKALTTAPVIPQGVTNMSNTFTDCTSLTQAPAIPQGVTNMTGTFQGCTALTTASTIPSSVTNMTGTFDGCKALTTPPTIAQSVTNMQRCFKNCSSLTTAPNIPNSVTNMQDTFNGCSSLTQAPTIPSSVTDMTSCFQSCTSLTIGATFEGTACKIGQLYRGCTKLISCSLPLGGKEYLSSYSDCVWGCYSLTSITWLGEINISFNGSYLVHTSLPTETIKQTISDLVPEHLADLQKDEIKISFSNKKITINNTETTWEEE